MSFVMRIMLPVALTLLALAGCSTKSDQATKDTTAAAATPAPAAAAPTPALSLADVAGKWQMRAVPESGSDTTATTYVLTATADTAGWMITFPSGLKVPLRVMASGDSVTATTGTFASQRRKGVKVKTENTMRLQNGKIVGTTIAHYANAGADSVLHLRTEGTKMP